MLGCLEENCSHVSSDLCVNNELYETKPVKLRSFALFGPHTPRLPHWPAMVMYCFEPARSGRSKCVKCLSTIANRSLRLVESHYQATYFYHATCTPLKAVKWLSKKWPGVGDILAAHASVVTAAQLGELKLVLDSKPANAPTGTKKRKRVNQERRASKDQQVKDRAELENLYPVGRKGVISVRHDTGRFGPHHVTNHFVKVTRCTPRFVEVREYEHQSEICFQDICTLITRVQADWERPREKPVFGGLHRVERHRLTGTFGNDRQCKPFKDKVQTCYLFEGDFMPADDHGAIITSTDSADLDPGDDADAVHVRTISGKLLLRMSEGKARESFVKDIIREIEGRVGIASQVQVLAANELLEAGDPISALLAEGACLALTVIFKTKPAIVDRAGREFPHLVDFLDRRPPMHPTVKNIDEAFDAVSWLP